MHRGNPSVCKSVVGTQPHETATTRGGDEVCTADVPPGDGSCDELPGDNERADELHMHMHAHAPGVLDAGSGAGLSMRVEAKDLVDKDASQQPDEQHAEDCANDLVEQTTLNICRSKALWKHAKHFAWN